MTPQQSAAVLSAALANDKKNGVLRISGMVLSKHERAELHRVVGAYGAACTVKMARDFCSPGPKMTAFYTVLTVLLFLGLAALWLPFLLCALLAVFGVPMRVAAGKARWAQILPPERDEDRLELL